MTRIFTPSLGKAPGETNEVMAIAKAIKAGDFNNITGAESFASQLTRYGEVMNNTKLSNVLRATLGDAVKTDSQRADVIAAMNLSSSDLTMPNSLQESAKELHRVTGQEQFSSVNDPGRIERLKAVNISLNAMAHSQTDAANEMFKEVKVDYTTDNLNFTVRASGLSRYVFGADAFQSASDSRPLLSLIRKKDLFIDDTMRLVPVYPESENADELVYFVDKADVTPWIQPYSKADGLKRTEHLTSFLKVGEEITNLLGLCQTPGGRVFDHTNDEIERNSISVKTIQLKMTIDSETKSVFIDTTAMTNNTFAVSDNNQTNDDRSLNFKMAKFTLGSLLKRTEAGVYEQDDFVAKLAEGGYIPYFSFELKGTFWRKGNRLTTQAGKVTLLEIHDKAGNVYPRNTQDEKVSKLFKAYKGGVVEGIELNLYHNNLNRTNFGYRIEVYDANKVLATRIQTPISVMYPVTKEDINQDSLQVAKDDMVTALQIQTTAQAFNKAEGHIAELTRLNGHAIVGADAGSNVMAGMHFLNVTTIHRSFALKDTVSTDQSVNLLDNVEAAFVNNITEIIGALDTNSSLAAISEYRRIDVKWIVIGHTAFTRYFKKTGDARSAGAGVNFRVVETNMDHMIGKFYIFPESKTQDTTIDVIGGMGIMVSRPHRVYEANLTRSNADFGIMVMQPYYDHHGVGVVAGTLTITDAHQALTDEGLFRYLSAQRIKLINSKNETIDAIGGAGEGSDTNTDNDTEVGPLP